MISILMPVKNADKYLEECLDSIVNQTYTNWELIAVNDHSTDYSEDMLHAYADEHSGIKIYQNTGHGIISALQLAEQKSSGEFISRMDADDIMAHNKLEVLFAAINEHPVIATSYVRYFSEGELGEGYQKYEQWLNGLVDTNQHYEEIYKECVLPSPNWLMHRNTFNRLGGFGGIRYPEDYDLCFRAYAHQIEIIGVQQVLHHWRDYPSRTSRTNEHYKDNAFLQLKARYFHALDFDPKTKLVLWGAGSKGKKLAKILLDLQLNFKWITNNPNKLTAPIFGKALSPISTLETQETQAIIAVSGPQDQLQIQQYLKENPQIRPYWFC